MDLTPPSNETSWLAGRLISRPLGRHPSANVVRGPFGKLLSWTGIPVFVYLGLLAVAHDPLPKYSRLRRGTVHRVLLFLVLLSRVVQPRRSAHLVALVVIATIAITLRTAWAVVVPTTPVSDFRTYHDAAIQLSRGLTPLNLATIRDIPFSFPWHTASRRHRSSAGS